MKSIRVVVRGAVQGVGYRWYTRDIASNSGVTGWIRNCRDGTVEAELHGTDAALEAVLSSMTQGPAGARVDDVTVSEISGASAVDFEIRPTS